MEQDYYCRFEPGDDHICDRTYCPVRNREPVPDEDLVFPFQGDITKLYTNCPECGTSATVVEAPFSESPDNS